ncbi:MAG: phage tail protein [Magnetococcales bacterium]|nr:phage tail protein [Magnetococcales bacterium]
MTQADEYYPPGAFYFSVSVIGSATLVTEFPEIDASFQEVSGINAEFGMEEIAEGGENRFVHRLPQRVKYSNLVLKRGVVTKKSMLTAWVDVTMSCNFTKIINPQNLLVSLLNNQGNPTLVWVFVNAYPIKWEVGNMSSKENTILTETLEFSYNYFEQINVEDMSSLSLKLKTRSNC